MLQKNVFKLSAVALISIVLAACASSTSSVTGTVSSKEGTVRELVRNVGDRVFFETDSSRLSASARNTISKQAAVAEYQQRQSFD